VQKQGEPLKFSTNRKTKRLSCHQPVQILVSQKETPRQYTVISGVITNVTQNGLFIKTRSKVEIGKLFFSYTDEKTNTTIYFDCDVLRTDLDGIAVTYNLLSDSDQENLNCRCNVNPVTTRKGRFLDYYF
jgi:hypothetical protein